MYNAKNIAYLLTALEAIEKIFLYTTSVQSAQEFLEKDNQIVFNACQTLIMVIGEETKKLDQELKGEFSGIPWPLIAKSRNRIAHDYRSINPEISFDIIKNYLPELKSVLIQMVDRIDYDKDKLNKVLDSSYYKNIRYLKR